MTPGMVGRQSGARLARRRQDLVPKQRRRRSTVRRRLGTALLAGALVGALAAPGGAQTPPNEINVSVNYVYAAQLGFGSYHVGGLSVSVYSLPVEYTLRDVLLDWRLKVGLPLLYGTYDFNKTVI